MRILGFEDTLPLNKYRITGEEYRQFNEVLQLLVSMLQKAGFAEADLLFVDYFLYEIWSSEKSKEKSNLDLGAEFDHDEIQHQIEQIGFWLGFETEVEKLVSPGAVVDVIWRAKIVNLEVVTYVFEVHKSGSIDSLILNLQKARNNPTVQKVVAISDRLHLDKIQSEIRGLPEDFRNVLTFWDVIDVQKAHQNLSEVSEIIAQLELVKGEFPE